MYLFYCRWTVRAIMNTPVHVLYMYPHIHMHIPRSRITGSLGLCFTFLAVFQNACTNLHSYQQSVSVSIVPHSHQHFTVFLNFSHSGGCVEESRCGLICLSLRTNEVRQLSEHLLYNSLLWSVCWSLLSTFSVEWAVFSVLIWPNPLHILDTSAEAEAFYRFCKNMIHTWQRMV